MNRKLLNLTEADRKGCQVTFNVNRFEVYHANGWLLTATKDKVDLKQQISENGLVSVVFDSVAAAKYLAS
jgi:hypothetical protein